MLSVFTFSFLATLFTVPFGIFFIKNNTNNNLYNFSKHLIFGLILLSFLSLCINFFLPLNLYISSIIPIISILIIFKYRKDFLNKYFSIFLVLNSILIFFLILESNVYRPDSGLYHLPFIGILNSENIVIGLSNLHFRYGHTSMMQYLAAINYNIIFKSNGIVFAQALVASSVIINFTSQLFVYNKSRNYNFHFFYLLFVFVYISYKMNRYSEYGNDAPAHFMLFFLISEALLYYKKKNNSYLADQLLLTFFIIANKITLLLVILINFSNLKKINIISFIKSFKFILISILFSAWVIKNILNTGCAIYPLKITCFESLSWTNINEVQKVSRDSEMWTKDWSNFKNIDGISEEQFLKNFNWFNVWSENHLRIIFKNLFPYLILCLLIMIFIKNLNRQNRKVIIDKDYIYFFIIILLGSIFWFIKSPLLRYGYSFLVSFIAFIFSFYCIKIQFNNPNNKKYFNYILILGIFIFLAKNIVRIYSSNNNYYNYPWPKYYSMDNQNIKNNLKKINLDGIYIYNPEKDKYCMYSLSICFQYQLKKNIHFKEKNRYKIFFLK